MAWICLIKVGETKWMMRWKRTKWARKVGLKEHEKYLKNTWKKNETSWRWNEEAWKMSISLTLLSLIIILYRTCYYNIFIIHLNSNKIIKESTTLFRWLVNELQIHVQLENFVAYSPSNRKVSYIQYNRNIFLLLHNK